MAVPLSLQAVLPHDVAVLPPFVVGPQKGGLNIPRTAAQVDCVSSIGFTGLDRRMKGAINLVYRTDIT